MVSIILKRSNEFLVQNYFPRILFKFFWFNICRVGLSISILMMLDSIEIKIKHHRMNVPAPEL